MKSKVLTRRRFVQAAGTAALLAGRVPAAVPAPVAPRTGKPAVLGGTPVRSTPFPAWPTIETSDERRFLDALRRGEWCRLNGDITTDFETQWARSLGAEHAIGVVNGTNALYAALNALHVGLGDEVLVPAYTFVATVNAVIQQFALPVFVDTDFETQQIDPASLASRLDANTRCAIPVHLGGGTADMDRVAEACAGKVPVVEDACQAHFAEWRGRRAGSIGEIGCFSFQASKILPCGEGGAVVTSDSRLYDRLHAFQNNGRDRLTGTRDGYLHQGTNLRMTEFQSALLLAQLARLERQCVLRAENAGHLTRLLAEIPGVEPAKTHSGCTRNTYYLYMARYEREHFSDLPKARFLDALEKEGIPAWDGYSPLNKEPFLRRTLESPAYRKLFTARRLRRWWEENECPANDRLCQQGFFIPHECLLGGKSDVRQVAEAIARIQQHSAEIAGGG